MTDFVRRALLAVEKHLPPALFQPERGSRIAVAVVNVLLVIALARALAGLTLTILAGPVLPSAHSSMAARAGSTTDPPATARLADTAVIASWHLFGQVEVGRPVAAAPTPAPVTPLNLRLVGVFFVERGSGRALALIADGNGPERGYRIGEPLPGGARLHRIQRDHVVVSRGGREEVLKLPKLGEATPPHAPAAPPLLAPPATPEPTAEPALESSGSRESPVIDASAVADRLRGEAMTRPQALEDIAFASPYLQNGQFIGFRLRPGRDRQIFQQLGLNGGDVITEINGSRLNSPAQGLTLLQEVLNADQINVRVLRNGAEIPLIFSLRGAPPR